MPSTGFGNAYKLDTTTIDRFVTKTSPGAYVLGKENDKGGFIVEYVGRSDIDLNKRLKDHASSAKYPLFKFGYTSTVKEAFEKECTLYHDFGENKKLDNDIHPRTPDGKNYSCPVRDCDS